MSPCPRPSHSMCPGTAAQGVSGIPGARWLPARGSRHRRRRRRRGDGRVTATLPSPFPVPAEPHMALTMGLCISDSTGAQSPDSWSGSPAPPNPLIPSSGLGAGSWERAMFSPSAPDDAGGFFGSRSLLRQREQNQSGCLVGLETNKTPWQALRAGRSGQRGAGMGSQRPEIPGHGLLLSGKGEVGRFSTLAPDCPLSQHLERPLMSVECPWEQIAIELDLHQPPALTAAILSCRAPKCWN